MPEQIQAEFDGCLCASDGPRGGALAQSVLLSGCAPPMERPALIPFWTLSRGEQVITCELVRSGRGPAILRCGYGPQTVVRSQFISSPAAATAVSETWRAALLLQGFRVHGGALSTRRTA